jgi:hypothetical protein
MVGCDFDTHRPYQALEKQNAYSIAGQIGLWGVTGAAPEPSVRGGGRGSYTYADITVMRSPRIRR